MTDDSEVARKAHDVLFPNLEGDASYNLEGVIADLEGQFSPNDGGVCVRTIRRVVIQLEQARSYLQSKGGDA